MPDHHSSASILKESLWSIALFLLALVPRLLWVLNEHPQPFSDMEDYYRCAINFLRGDYLAQSPERLAYRPPLYPLFLAGIIQLYTAEHLLAIRVAQAVLGALSVVLLYLLGRQMCANAVESGFLRFVPVLAAASYALLDTPIFFTAVLMSETLFIFFLLLWLNWLLLHEARPRYWLLCVNAIFLGVLALVRPIVLFLLPIVLYQMWKTLQPGERLRKMWLPLLGWLLPILPWTLRNIMIFNTFVFITTNSGVNFFIGHSPAFGYYEGGLKEPLRQEYARRYGYSEVGEDRFFFQMGLRHIVEDPAALLQRSYYKLYFLYWLNKVPWPWDEYRGGQGIRFAYDIPWPVLGWSRGYVLMTLAGIGFAFYRHMNHIPLLLSLFFYTAACLVFFARTRFRLPIEPIVVLYAWTALLSLIETLRTLYGKRR